MRLRYLLISGLAMCLSACNPGDTLDKAPDYNEHKNFAAGAYMNEAYDTAAYTYGYLVDSAGYLEPLLMLNHAHALYRAGDTATARLQYQRLLEEQDSSIQSKVYNQLGVLTARDSRKKEQSLELFKNALLTNPANDIARYNYEIVKMLLADEMPDGPSDFAKQLKEKSDELVRNNKFVEAYQLMIQGLGADMTVSFYMDYIQRLRDIAEIEESEL